jgi:hypothetical protein
MEDNKYRTLGIQWAQHFMVALDPTFATESFLNAVEFKVWLGNNIKVGLIGGYRNLEYNNYKAVFDLVTRDLKTYHMGIDFGQQAVHVTLGPGDVYSLYYKYQLGS